MTSKTLAKTALAVTPSDFLRNHSCFSAANCRCALHKMMKLARNVLTGRVVNSFTDHPLDLSANCRLHGNAVLSYDDWRREPESHGF